MTNPSRLTAFLLLALALAAPLCGCNKDAETTDAASPAASPSSDAAQTAPGGAAPMTRTKAGPVGAPR